jgi:signal transduction histidine kinase
VKDLAAFARPDLRRTPLRLAEVAQEAMRWLPASAALDATIRVEDAGAPDVFASAGQIEQVVVNLVTNAVKATPAGKRAAVIVRVGPGSPGKARLEVVDHGTGIDPSTLDRIFEPFFTTRPAGDGRGVGLGLSISHSIVASHGGTLTVGSEVGKGSTLRMELPGGGTVRAGKPDSNRSAAMAVRSVRLLAGRTSRRRRSMLTSGRATPWTTSSARTRRRRSTLPT